MRRLTFSTLLAALSAGPIAAQEPKADPVPLPEISASARRSVVPLRHADPVALALALGRHFKGLAEVSAVPGGLLISAAPEIAEQITKLVAETDRGPKSVEVEVALVEMPIKPESDGREADLGTDPTARLETLAKAGMATVRRIKLTAVEGQPVSSNSGGSKPFSTSSVVPGGGRAGAAGGFPPPVQRSISYRDIGTTVRLTARTGGEAIGLDLNVQDSRVRQPDPADEGGAASFETCTLETRLSVPPGRAVVAQAVRSDAKAGGTLMLVVVTARVVEPAATPKAK